MKEIESTFRKCFCLFLAEYYSIKDVYKWEDMTIIFKGDSRFISLITEKDEPGLIQISIETPRDYYDKNIFECISNEYESIISKYWENTYNI